MGLSCFGLGIAFGSGAGKGELGFAEELSGFGIDFSSGAGKGESDEAEELSGFGLAIASGAGWLTSRRRGRFHSCSECGRIAAVAAVEAAMAAVAAVAAVDDKCGLGCRLLLWLQYHVRH